VDGVEQIHGDRAHDLVRLAGRHWDAVIDTSGYLPGTVRASAELLAGAVERYVFVSSVSAYGTFPRPGVSEDAPLAPPPPPDTKDVLRY
jgi:2'-hydroxyisoflavone reductase